MHDGVERSVDLSTDARVSHGTQPSRVRRWLREPLLHFLLIGAGLFAVFHFCRPARDSSPASNEICLLLDELAQLALVF